MCNILSNKPLGLKHINSYNDLIQLRMPFAFPDRIQSSLFPELNIHKQKD